MCGPSVCRFAFGAKPLSRKQYGLAIRTQSRLHSGFGSDYDSTNRAFVCKGDLLQLANVGGRGQYGSFKVRTPTQTSCLLRRQDVSAGFVFYTAFFSGQDALITLVIVVGAARHPVLGVARPPQECSQCYFMHDSPFKK